jgi:hypothetical protein
MTPIQELMRAVAAILVTDGWELTDDLGHSWLFARGHSVLNIGNQTDVCAISGYVRESDLAGRARARNPLIGYDGPPADCVTSFSAIFEPDGSIRLDELVAEEGALRPKTVERKVKSAAELCDIVTTRTDAEVARRLART